MTLFLLLLLLIPFVFVFIKQYFLKRQLPLPPGPNALQVLPYLSSLIHKPHIALQTLSKIYGPLFSLKLGHQIMVVASSPDAAMQFCKIRDRVFCGRHLPAIYRSIPGTVHSSILLSPECNKSWKHLRSMSQNSVSSSKAVESSASIRKAKVMEMVRFIIQSKQGKEVNVEDMMFATLANVISSVVASTNLFEIEQDGYEHEAMMGGLIVNEVLEKTITFDVVDFLPILKVVDFWTKRKARYIHRKIKLMWGGIIHERRRKSISTVDSVLDHNDDVQDFLDVVLADGSFSDDQIGNALMEMLIGATDSTTITTVWLVAELMRNEETLSRVREEIAETAQGDDGLNESLLSECRYFEAYIKETLRLHVPAPLLVPHRAIESCKLGNYVIPRDSMVVVNAWGIARDHKYWEDAETFNPERFFDPNIGANFEYLPFGTGLRMCPGSALAFKNIQMLVGSLLHYFDWSLPNGDHPTAIDMTEKYVTTLKREKPLLLIPKLRVL